MTKTKAAASGDIDPSSEEPVLGYKGPGHIGGIPARHLNGGDLARIAYVRAINDNGGKHQPKPATTKQLAAIADELVASGHYGHSIPADEAPPTEPDAPAEEPEA